MAIETPCQTPDTVFSTHINENVVVCIVNLPFDLNLTEEGAQVLEANIHNMMELVFKPYFDNSLIEELEK